MVTRRTPRQRLVVAVTGASGAVLGVRLLERLRERDELETHLVVSRNAERVLRLETGWTAARLRKLADHAWNPDALDAPIASGSFRTRGMVVVPCSIKTLSAVANCFAADLVGRAADVTLKQRRPLVLVVRETPLHAGQLRQMMLAAQAGATILPPVPAFYARPRSIADLVDQTVARILDALGIDDPLLRRWRGG
ncbi:MAG: UbiX family flavin prenyltransferase [Deltaproteobacteria bacterium]|nr:UbiX family flavin prenyltransferase [Deltaproteobacteria bacterium]